MCILCVIQKWSRKVATMLPWLVIPLIGLWLLSQFLPPAFRFEITSPRLACVLVLLVTLFWYEVLMPQLSSWRVRRNARIKERKRLEAIEMQKLRKNAVRKCRNCKTPYRDQNPCGGKFNCCYCGHKSKRPEMDQLCVASDLGRFSSSGILKDLVGKVWADNNWICGQDWLENGGNWVNGSFSGKSSYLKKNSGGFFGSGNDYFFSFLLVFVCKSLAAILLGIIWIFVRLFRFSFDDGDTSMESDINGLSKKGENGVNCNETKSEKARRKAEEKRQARLEREQLEEEERKQREEVARLVEERRKLRDENDNKHNKKAFKALPRDNKDKKEAERKRQERKKEWDRGSSRSNSDVDELEKRANKEIEKSKKGEADREHNRSKGSMADSYNKGSVGARYLDRMRGNFFPSSKTLTGGGFFGKGVNANANANASNTREHRSNASLDHSNKKDFVQPERAFGKSNAHADDKNQNRLARFESHPCPPPKRSWHQLFSRSSPTSSSTNINVISRPNGNSQTEAQSSIASGYPVSQGYDIPATQGLPYHLPNYSYGNTTSSIQLSSNVAEHENFEDPCYVPDPVLSVGPVSEPHDSFPVDFGFLGDIGFEKPSPIASPVSRPRSDSSVFPSPQRTQENTNLPMDDHGAAIEKGWQAWNSCRYMPDMSYVGAKTKWNLPQKSSASILKEEDYVLSNTTGLMHANSDDSWTFRTSYGSISSSNNHLSMNPHEGVTHNELVYEIPNGSAINHQFQPYHSVVWAKKEKVACQVSVEGIETIPTIIGPRGGLYPPLDVQPVWSYE